MYSDIDRTSFEDLPKLCNQIESIRKKRTPEFGAEIVVLSIYFLIN